MASYVHLKSTFEYYFIGGIVKHSDLIVLWKKQNELKGKWQRDLLESAENIRQHVETLLEPPAERYTVKTQNGIKAYRYVEVVDITSEDSPVIGNLIDSVLTEGGEFVLGIGITLDNGVKAYPKSTSYIPIAIRFRGKAPEYAFYNQESGEFSKWDNNIEQMSRKLIKKVSKILSHSPYNGQIKDSSIGFLE